MESEWLYLVLFIYLVHAVHCCHYFMSKKCIDERDAIGQKWDEHCPCSRVHPVTTPCNDCYIFFYIFYKCAQTTTATGAVNRRVTHDRFCVGRRTANWWQMKASRWAEQSSERPSCRLYILKVRAPLDWSFDRPSVRQFRRRPARWQTAAVVESDRAAVAPDRAAIYICTTRASVTSVDQWETVVERRWSILTGVVCMIAPSRLTNDMIAWPSTFLPLQKYTTCM